MRLRRCASGLLGAGLLLTPWVGAQPVSPASPPSPSPASATPGASRVAEAQRGIAEGMRAFRARDYQAAIHAFEAANAAAPSPDLWFNIARAREMSGDYAAAIEDYRRYLRDKVDAPDRADVERRIADLERMAEIQRASRLHREQQTSLRFEIDGPLAARARYHLDARVLTLAEARSPTVVPPGEHTVRVEGDGLQTWSARVRVREGEPMGVYVSLQPETRYRTIPHTHVLSYIAGGLSLASLAASGVYALRAVAADDYDQQVSRAGRSDVFLGLGVGLAVGAVITYFVERGLSRTEMVREAPR